MVIIHIQVTNYQRVSSMDILSWEESSIVIHDSRISAYIFSLSPEFQTWLCFYHILTCFPWFSRFPMIFPTLPVLFVKVTGFHHCEHRLTPTACQVRDMILWCVFMCTCILYMYIYIYIIYIYIYHTKYRHTSSYVHTYIHTYLHTYLPTYIHTCMQRYKQHM